MEKIWFIDIGGKTEGPFSFYDLRADSRITPDTWVWKKGFEGWKKAREVPELRSLFEDSTPNDEEPVTLVKKTTLPPRDELTLEMREPPYLWWIIIAILALSYVIFKFHSY